MSAFDYAVVGGGIVGLAVAHELIGQAPGRQVLVLEKEPGWARHQTGRNSGVIHSGIYYRPGSLKARLSAEGSRSMVAFCREQGIPHEVCGKVIVATSEAELPLLENLFRRGQENGLAVERLTSAQVRAREPHVACLAGVWVPSTGIVDYRAVCERLAILAGRQGATLRCGNEVVAVRVSADALELVTPAGTFSTRFLVNCGGLQSDRLARLCGVRPPARIVPFRGEYYELRPAARALVKGLIYPVPDPEFPFLGVHFTRMIDGSVHAGPNAVLSLKREGYHRTAFDWGDALETLTYPGFWRLAAKQARSGLGEMHRSFSRGAFLRSLQRLIPEVTDADLVPAEPGVRAQALAPDGKLVDDFLMVEGERALHVLNAPSPAATAALEIARVIVGKCID